MKKKLIAIIAALFTATALASCGAGTTETTTAAADTTTTATTAKEAADSGETVKVTIGVSPAPHYAITNIVKELVAEQGVDLEIKEFTDYVQPNLALSDGDIDLNYFQHEPYLDKFVEENNLDNLVSVAKIHVEPMGVYSTSIESLDELKDGDTVLIPNDATNGGRALILLAENNVITLEDKTDILSSVNTIVDNPKNLKFTEVEAVTIPTIYNDAAIAVINTNYAIEAGLKPGRDSIVIEGTESPYANILVARTDNQNDEAIQKVVAAFHSEEVRKYIDESFGGDVVPSF